MDLKRVEKGTTASLSLFIASSFAFLNTEYDLFANNFMAWGQYVIFPGIILTELMLAVLHTYRYYRQNKATASDPYHGPKVTPLSLFAAWTKAILVSVAMAIALTDIPSIQYLFAPLLMTGLGFFAVVNLCSTLYTIHKGAQALMQKGMPANQAYRTQFREHGYKLIAPLAMLTIVFFVGLSTYVPEMVMAVIPEVAPLAVIAGVVAGLTLVVMSLYSPRSPKNNPPDQLKLAAHDPKDIPAPKPTFMQTNTSTLSYKPFSNVNPANKGERDPKKVAAWEEMDYRMRKPQSQEQSPATPARKNSTVTAATTATANPVNETPVAKQVKTSTANTEHKIQFTKLSSKKDNPVPMTKQQQQQANERANRNALFGL